MRKRIILFVTGWAVAMVAWWMVLSLCGCARLQESKIPSEDRIHPTGLRSGSLVTEPLSAPSGLRSGTLERSSFNEAALPAPGWRLWMGGKSREYTNATFTSGMELTPGNLVSGRTYFFTLSRVANGWDSAWGPELRYVTPADTTSVTLAWDEAGPAGPWFTNVVTLFGSSNVTAPLSTWAAVQTFTNATTQSFGFYRVGIGTSQQ